MVDRGFEEGELNIDWDNLLDNLPDDLNFDFCDEPIVDGFSTSPNSVCSLSIDDIEQYLMGDESNNPEDKEQNVVADGFFSDVVLDSSPGSGTGSGSDRCKESSASPESAVEVETDEEEKGKDKPHENVYMIWYSRQMRNRDAAVRSRERKKMYVRDLEMKSKYYEAECKRLGIMLQCCLAENQALRLSMHNSKAFDASMTKQESAVLLLESLLLGSLLGFLGIIYLLILPSHLLSTLEAGLRENVDSVEWESVAAPRKAGNKVCRVLFNSFMMGKRCKASRSRMKLRLSATEVVVVL
ncbi:hypothetical protein DH2020_049445 [Rehmannia glutinosa]|uniref:BZIP domain-containing protein n=1 Tax=Rehmannia glutinosa TaxID=99300 RepID=A0ABR0U3Y2_REHGL